MKSIDTLLNPARIRAKITGRNTAVGNDDGAMLVEAMIYFVIVVLIAAQIIPELMKSLEKAEVDNMRAAVTTLSGDIQIEHGYTGQIMYTKAELDKALAASKKSEGVKMAVKIVDANNATGTTKNVGYVVTAESTNSKNYCVQYSSQGFKSGTGSATTYSQFQVKAKGTCL